MNILCSFALSQLKRKKSRTVITALAIALFLFTCRKYFPKTDSSLSDEGDTVSGNPG